MTESSKKLIRRFAILRVLTHLVPYLQIIRILVNELTIMTTISNNTCRKLRVSAFKRQLRQRKRWWLWRRQVIVSVDGGSDKCGEDVRDDEDGYGVGKSNGGGVYSNDNDND